MSTSIQTRRDFLAKATVVAALGASTSKLFGEQTPSVISDESIKHAEQLAGITFSESERRQMLNTIQEQQAMLATRIAQGEIPNDLSPATVFNPRIPGMPLQLSTSTGNVTHSLPRAGPCPRANEELAFAPVWKLSQWLRKREITSLQLTELCIERSSISCSM